MEALKKIAGVTAAQYVKDGMTIGLGTGSTAYFFVEEIGRRVKEEGLDVVGVTTSSATTKQAQGLGIPLKAVDEIDSIDITVDGADEVDKDFNGIKGGGAALLMEKIVATPTKEYIWVVDESKMVEHLGAFKLPVEVVQYGAERLFRVFEKSGYQPSFRMKDSQKLITDMQNYIIDLDLKKIENPLAFAEMLDTTVGVVEHGLFNGMVNKVIVAGKNGVEVLEAPKH
ncbi:ribose-5-phosphate isomerase [Streptococcus penaeicida]|uniref:Ribose-5-phosphate isomerase A n=1 Tax=Streptococcus penaeicida TaxID=1765960 RepID=A0A2N8LD47_9STRE|nr:ribose-5-phosphate isomerase RpiA [Streptococcus penaeicida]PND48082.1 ribose-5-phosphate isomerase [Streptococcus penaeicida]